MNLADSVVWMCPDLCVAARQPLYALWDVWELGIASHGDPPQLQRGLLVSCTVVALC